jgi:hypothetical protein
MFVIAFFSLIAKTVLLSKDFQSIMLTIIKTGRKIIKSTFLLLKICSESHYKNSGIQIKIQFIQYLQQSFIKPLETTCCKSGVTATQIISIKEILARLSFFYAKKTFDLK